MRRLLFLLPSILFFLPIFAQNSPSGEYVQIDKKALQLPDSLATSTTAISEYINKNFSTEKEKTRAIFIWLASNIQYDIDNMFNINFYETKEDKISKALKTRKGICSNYAALFTDICSKSGIQSFVVEGYTKQNGFTGYLPHAWCAALLDTSWFLFDPTWGSGYISNEKFVKKINNDYFKVSPATLIKSHMPFDYLWQFLYYPISNQEFYEGKTQQNKTKPYFNFKDSIQVYINQNHDEQIVYSAYRVEKNGVKNAMVFDRLQHLKLEVENNRKNKSVDLYNSAVGDYNAGVNAFNEFIEYKNKQFLPKKEDPEIQDMIDVPDSKLKDALSKLEQIKNPDAHISNAAAQLYESIEKAISQVKQQRGWLNLYFSKSKAGRKSMFYKMTWMGIPLN